MTQSFTAQNAPRPRLGPFGYRGWMLTAIVVALAVRVAYLFDIAANPFFRTPVIDAEYYHQQAQLLASGGPLPHVPFQMPPLYPMLLSLVYRLFGADLVAAHGLQILFGTATVGLVFALAVRTTTPRFGPRPGLAAGLVAAGLVATNQSLLYLEGDLLATPLAVFLDTLALWFLVRWAMAPAPRRPAGLSLDLVGAGLALGLAALALPLVLACVPVFVGWIAWRRRMPAAAAALALLVAIPIVPVAIRNHRASSEWVLISANGGINAWMGNNPDWRRTSTLRPGPEWRAMQEMPVREAGIVPSSERDRWFQRQAVRYWTATPLAALGSIAAKTLLLVHDHDIMRDFDFYYFRAHFSRLLRLPGFGFAWLVALAGVELLVAGGMRRWTGREARAAATTPTAGVAPLVPLFVASYAFGIVLFFVTARYRAPLVPALAVLGAPAILWAAALVQRRAWRRLVPGIVVFGTILVLAKIDWFGVDRVDVAEAEYRVATTAEKQGHYAAAFAQYDAVLKRDPNHALAAARAAFCAQLLGQAQQAVDRYETLLERHPEYAEAAVNLANLASQGGARDAAQHYFEVALAADPFLPQAHASYGSFLLQGGDARGAAAAFGKALAYDPTWELLRIDYATALLQAGDVAAARREYERAAAILPRSAALDTLRAALAAAPAGP